MKSTKLSEKIKVDVPSIEFKEHTLDNGLRVVMSKFGNVPMVVINTTFHVGSKDEDENKTGLAHLFEHLMFEGSGNFPNGKFDKILNQHGGESNAYTSRDSTSYYIVLPSNYMEIGMWLDSDRINEFLITEDSLSIQKDVILEEKLLYVDNSPYGTLEEESSKKLFKNTGYRWPVIGNMDQLQKISLNEVHSFFERYYMPNNAVISIVGDIDYDKTLRSVEKYYGDIKPGSQFERKSYYEDEISEEVKEFIYDNIQLPGKFIFYRLPKMGTKQYYAMNIINGILGAGESSRLYQELEYKSQLANEIDTTFYGMEEVSLFFISAIAMKGRSLDEIQFRIDEIIEDLKNGNISDSEIQKIKNKIETSYNIKRQSIISLADRLSYLKTFYNDCDKMNFEILDYLSITRDDLLETANRYLNKDQRVILNYLPKDNIQ